MMDFIRQLKFYLPQSSTMAPKIDLLYDFIYWASVFMLVPTIAAMLYFGWKYRKTNHDREVPYIEGHPLFEWVVSAVLGAIFLVIFIWGLIGFNEIYAIPDNAYEISVTGKQWMWEFTYQNGKTTTNDLYIPKGMPVKLIMGSPDVLHSFYVPNFRLKQDIVPGMYTTLWFEAPDVGEHEIMCTEYCGTAHSNMLGKVIVLEQEQFKAWLRGVDPQKVNISDLGKKLFEKRNCVACHSVNGTESKAGPALNAVYNKKVQLATGETVTADENYLRNSILNPAGQVVKGFRPVMPTFQGLLNEGEINAIVAYLKTLSPVSK
ncbi:MAG: cytochrome c oxidase subunit II [Oligoflexia bacterium]|nr:cytochrome c oxidase subunit II [Oligoflexia bacterium]